MKNKIYYKLFNIALAFVPIVSCMEIDEEFGVDVKKCQTSVVGAESSSADSYSATIEYELDVERMALQELREAGVVIWGGDGDERLVPLVYNPVKKGKIAGVVDGLQFDDVYTYVPYVKTKLENGDAEYVMRVGNSAKFGYEPCHFLKVLDVSVDIDGNDVIATIKVNNIGYLEKSNGSMQVKLGDSSFWGSGVYFMSDKIYLWSSYETREVATCKIDGNEIKLKIKDVWSVTPKMNLKVGHVYMQYNYNFSPGETGYETPVRAEDYETPVVVSAHEKSCAVDLGLSVKWCDHNYGAKSRYESGSTCARERRIEKLWGNGWRTPTPKEIEELESKCTKEFIADENQAGYRYTGPNGQSIFIPVAQEDGMAKLYCVDESGGRVAIISTNGFGVVNVRDVSYCVRAVCEK